MHACTRSAKQKYGSIYIFLDENVFENGCIYIYIYIYIYIVLWFEHCGMTELYHMRGTLEVVL